MESVSLTVNDLNQEPALRHTVIVFRFNFRYSNVPGAVEHSIQERVNPAQAGTWDKGGGLAIVLRRTVHECSSDSDRAEPEGGEEGLSLTKSYQPFPLKIKDIKSFLGKQVNAARPF